MFTIIIPTYNSENTLSNSIDSILKQTFTDFEILIMDGVSTDKTVEIAKSYNDSRIIVHSEKDKGIYDAMNKGIQLAKGNWLIFLGSDDKLFDANVLSKVAKIIFANTYDVIYGDVYSTRFNGRYDGEFGEDKILKKNICHQAIFFNKSVFKKVGNFDLNYKVYADWDHNLRWMLNPKIDKKYVDIVISDYADGGFSSQNSDPIFLKEKQFNVFLYGRFSKTYRQKIKRLLKELRANKSNKRLLKKIMLNSPKILFNV